MQEDPLVRSIRRSLSQRLTKLINTSTQYPEVRLAVLHSLSTLWARLESLKDALRKEYGLDPAQPLFYFYMKGGNAYECMINPNGPAATTQGGGDSDWDTQIVVDPWAPLPIQNMLYAAIEDLVMDELRNCAVEIARLAPNIVSPDEYMYEAQTPQRLFRYKVTRDEPQTIRQVLAHNKTGLWLDTGRQFSETTLPRAVLPGMVFNDGIAPFQLFRLGYTWHAQPLGWPPPPPPLIPGAAMGPSIERPLLMELIDVTLPRRNTVEAIETWEELRTRKLVITAGNVSLLTQGPPATPFTLRLPLPSLDYHFNEQVLMLCEVAAGVSKSVDKVARRFARLATIYAATPAQQARYQAEMGEMAGVSVTELMGQFPANAHVTRVNNILNNNGAGQILNNAAQALAQAPAAGYNLQNPPPPEVMAINMMYQVAGRRIVYLAEDCLRARELLDFIFARLLQQFEIVEAGASDDLALYSAVVRNGYFDTRDFPASGMHMSAFLRVRDADKLEDAAQFLCNNLPGWLFNLATAAARIAPTLLDTWVSYMFFGKVITVKLREHTTFRLSGSTLEETLVVFADGRAVACITLTSAIPSEAPFLPDPLMPGVLLASVTDMAEQRKVAAAVIKDFCIRDALSKQLQLLNNLFPSIWSRSL